ncbi:SHOCT domain-containing protein [Virgibacillus halodenitrificans]|uniref:SHOCT domain-containing protein n=1 Tax=Virgibacillus halodenitrificans TaxID=1482 RepID=UPI001F1A0F7D|nr:SHOCT domain-containing protein [Virgibacillus halodenitrificans]MCG1027413.1 SHOCT domain-containing protein [Virgibacillus halodenitrificans]
MLGSLFTEPYIRLILGIFLLLIILYIVKRFKGDKQRRPDSLEIMKGKLAKGEITQEEYEEARKRRGK